MDYELAGYRFILFEELLSLCPKNYFKDKEILEIGPKDGRDSKRLSSLQPSKLTMVDLPEKKDLINSWLGDIACPKEYIEANFMYSSLFDPDSFSLIWCTGVLYHNAEQLRMLRNLYHLLKTDGYLVIESAVCSTDRNPSDSKKKELSKILEDSAYVEIYYPEAHKGTRSVTHLPSKKAIEAWLLMSGFEDVHPCDCHESHDKGSRYAVISRKKRKTGNTYYYNRETDDSPHNPPYYLGDSL